MKDYFTYNNLSTVPDNAIRISPSQLSKFFDSTSQWYRETLLGEAGFLGSTASKLGDCVHAAAAMTFDTGHVDMTAINNYISSISNPDVDTAVIREQLPHMIPLISNYVLQNRPSTSEEFLSYQLRPGIYVAGTLDAYSNNGILTDYKTTSPKSLPTSFPRNYYFQLMTYAWLLRKASRLITQLRLVYITRYIDGGISERTGKPLKSYPAELHTLNHIITDDDWSLIDGCLNVIADSVQLWQSHPEYRHILAQDNRLRQAAPPTLFKD